jgi:hypothetical protein
MTTKRTEEEHLKRHKVLHEILTAEIAQFIRDTRKEYAPSKTSIKSFAEWLVNNPTDVSIGELITDFLYHTASQEDTTSMAALWYWSSEQIIKPMTSPAFERDVHEEWHGYDAQEETQTPQ